MTSEAYITLFVQSPNSPFTGLKLAATPSANDHLS